MKMNWLAATALKITAWKMVGGSTREWIAAGRRHQFRVTGMGKLDSENGTEGLELTEFFRR